MVLEPLSRRPLRCGKLEYSSAFSDPLQQEWRWPERYGSQPEILSYINHVADRFDPRRDVQFNTRITSAVFDAYKRRWDAVAVDGYEGFTLSGAQSVMA